MAKGKNGVYDICRFELKVRVSHLSLGPCSKPDKLRWVEGAKSGKNTKATFLTRPGRPCNFYRVPEAHLKRACNTKCT